MWVEMPPVLSVLAVAGRIRRKAPKMFTPCSVNIRQCREKASISVQHRLDARRPPFCRHPAVVDAQRQKCRGRSLMLACASLMVLYQLCRPSNRMRRRTLAWAALYASPRSRIASWSPIASANRSRWNASRRWPMARFTPALTRGGARPPCRWCRCFSVAIMWQVSSNRSAM